jgi:Leucine-rich repeat (LRR) protein
MEDEAAATSLREKPIIEPPPKKAGAVEDNTRLTETFAGHKDVPESVLSQIELRSLSLAYNNLTAIRSPISRLTNLTRLVVDHNNVARIASKISCLVNLQELGMANNLLTSLPNTSMIHLTLLQSLDLSFNRLQEFPECIIHLTSLRKLDLRCAIAYGALHLLAPNIVLFCSVEILE